MAEVEYLSYQDEGRLAALLLGRKIVSASQNPNDEFGGLLVLDDGTVLELEGNEGGCGCSSGDYVLTHVASVDNIITDVRINEDPADDYGDGAGVYEIFVFADNEEINVARFEGDDGNGYYGTGFSIAIRPPAK